MKRLTPFVAAGGHVSHVKYASPVSDVNVGVGGSRVQP